MEDTCFGEVREGSHEWKANPGIREPWHIKDVLADIWDYSTVTVEESQSVEHLFARLAETWSEEVGHMSSLSDRVKHPAYRTIVSLGWDVVPFLIADLQKTHRQWFSALSEITGIQPFDKSDVGNVRRMTAAWIDWWQKRKGL
jgi:hypothetical protein